MITVLFSCEKCGLADIPVQVPAREDGDVEAVVPWVRDVVGAAVSNEHSKRGPHCHVKLLTNVKIPCPDNAEFIGQQIE